jgi:replicative DNA helicase
MLQERDLLLITGIPGTGKTTYGDNFAKEFGFLHHDLEDNQTLNRFNAGCPTHSRFCECVGVRIAAP